MEDKLAGFALVAQRMPNNDVRLSGTVKGKRVVVVMHDNDESSCTISIDGRLISGLFHLDNVQGIIEAQTQ